MKKQPSNSGSSLSETMTSRIEIEELGDPVRQKEITDSVETVDGVIETKIEKGALYVSFDPLATNQKKIEQAIRSVGRTVKATTTASQRPHPDLRLPPNVKRPPIENARDHEDR